MIEIWPIAGEERNLIGKQAKKEELYWGVGESDYLFIHQTIM